MFRTQSAWLHHGPFYKGSRTTENSVWFSSFKMCNVRWHRVKFDSNKWTDAASKWSRKREFGTAFILSPPLVPRAMQNLWAIACELCGVQHGMRACFPRTNCPLGGNAAKLKVLSRLPVLQPEPLAIAAARRQSCCSERARAALWGSGTSDIRCWSCTALDPGTARSCGQQAGLGAWHKDAEHAWALTPTGVSDTRPAVYMKSSSLPGNMDGK